MSFAPSKQSTQRKRSPGGSPHKPERFSQTSRHGLESSSFMSGPRRTTPATAETDVSQKLEILENNLNRVSQQQDALLPLMNMVDLAPSVQKNEGALKNLHKKQADVDEKVTKLEQMIRSYQNSVDTTIHKLNTRPVSTFDAGLFLKNLGSIESQVKNQQVQFRELEEKFTTLNNAVGDQLQNELGRLFINVESRLDKHRQETITALGELKTGTNNNLKRFDEVIKDIMSKSEKFDDFMQHNDRAKIINDIDQLINTKNSEQSKHFKEKYDRDIENLYKEFGIIRSEMDLIYEERRQHKMAPYLNSLPKDATALERNIKVNNVEQAMYIHELEKFNRENTQRILYELQALDDRLESLKATILGAKANKDTQDLRLIDTQEKNALRESLEIISERYLNIKFQMEGAKKKYLFDMNRIDDKMEKLWRIRAEAEEEMEANPKNKRILAPELKAMEELPAKKESLVEMINKNLETTFTRLEIVEERIKENQEALRK